MTAKGDKFTLLYTSLFGILFLLFVYSHDLDRIFGLWWLLVPILLIPSLALAIFWLVALIRNMVRKYWRRAASILVAPFLAYAVFAGLAAAGVNPKSIRFAFNKASYIAQIERLPKAGEPRFKTFDWGSTGGVAVLQIQYTLVYDESDEVALPAAHRSATWRSRACPGLKECLLFDPTDFPHDVDVRKMDEHFYLVTQTW